jgi:outer membrane protein assembly factor BamB
MEPEKGKIQTTWKVGAPIRSQPAIENGRIYVGTQNGKVICINTGDARLTGWSTWGANAAHTNVATTGK